MANHILNLPVGCPLNVCVNCRATDVEKASGIAFVVHVHIKRNNLHRLYIIDVVQYGFWEIVVFTKGRQSDLA